MAELPKDTQGESYKNGNDLHEVQVVSQYLQHHRNVITRKPVESNNIMQSTFHKELEFRPISDEDEEIGPEYATHSETMMPRSHYKTGTTVRPGTPALSVYTLDAPDSDINQSSDVCTDYMTTQENIESISGDTNQDQHLHSALPPTSQKLYSLLTNTVQGNNDTRTVSEYGYGKQPHRRKFASHQVLPKDPNCHLNRQAHEDDMQNNLTGNRSSQSVNNFNHLCQSMKRSNNQGCVDEADEKCMPKSDDSLHQEDENFYCHHTFERRKHSNNDLLSSNSYSPVNLTEPSIAVENEVNKFAVLGASIYQGEWPMNRALWMSGPSTIGEKDSLRGLIEDEAESIMSFSTSTAISSSQQAHPLGAKVEMVYSLLSMLGSTNRDNMSKTLLEMSHNRESCIAMRQSGCLPLLVQLLHGAEHDHFLTDQDPSLLYWALKEARRRASQALHNIVYAHADDKRGRREARVLRLLEQIRDYSDYLRDVGSGTIDITQNENLDLHPGPAIAALMKLSFDEEHRHAMCLLGGLQAIAELIQTDHEVHGNTNDQFCITVRRYAGMALTNLTFGDGANKALLCSMKYFMQALVAQLQSPNEDLRQVTASVLRNLSWRADVTSKQILREVNAVVSLMKTAMVTNKESTLKSILSALWNLSAHCSVNKADICAIDGSLEFLVSTLTYKSTLKTLSIVENGGGILRNVSSHVAVREDYREVLRKHNCLQILLRHLKSPSLTVVSNACGTLWNLSARCQQDQQLLWELGAVGMLRNLIHSKHKMISMGSAAALKNLLAARPQGMGLGLSGYFENGLQPNCVNQNSSPSLLVRKQRALEADIDENLSETCDNIDSPKTSPTLSSKKFTFENRSPHYLYYLPGRMYHSINGHTSPLYVPRSESKDSLGSTRSEPPQYRTHRERFRIILNPNKHLPLDPHNKMRDKAEWGLKTNLEPDENTNLVMQLFRSLHGSAVNSNMQNHQNSPTKQLRDSTINVKRGAWEVANCDKEELGNGSALLQNGNIVNVIKGDSNQWDHTDEIPISIHSDIKHQTISPRHSYSSCYSKQKFKLSGSEIITQNIAPRERFSNEILHNDLTPFLCNERFGESDVLKSSHTASNFCDQSVKPLKCNMDPIQENVVLRRKSKDDLSHWSSSSTLKEIESDEASLDQTALAVSRCSSLSSLASCLHSSARSSWISDTSSRRTSGISPNEIPDSPPHEMKFTDKAPDAKSVGISRPRPAWPPNVNPIALSTSTSPHSKPNISTITPEPENTSDEVVKQRGVTTKSDSTVFLNLASGDFCPGTKISSSLGNEDDNAMDSRNPHSCLGLPNNSNSIHQHNNSKLHSRVNNLSSNYSYIRSGIPVKAHNIRLTQSVSNIPRPVVLSGSALGVSDIEIMQTEEMRTNDLNQGPHEKLHQLCDDNDNLLVKYLDKTRTSISQIYDNENPTHIDLQRKIINSTNSSCSLVQDISSHTFNQDQKKYSPNYDLYFQESRILDAHAVDELKTGSTSDDLDDEAIDGEKVTRRHKTSIPQIIRPWQPCTDSDVHPKQLQIMSQNLPIYKGSFLLNNKNEETGKKNTTDLNSKEISMFKEDYQDADVSSFIADSEVLQVCLDAGKQAFNRSKRNAAFKSLANTTSVNHYGSDEKSFHAFENEENDWNKGKQKISMLNVINDVIPDLLEGATCHTSSATFRGSECYNGSDKGNSLKIMSHSSELQKGALIVTAELEETADDQTHSSTSFSDLDNIKPPSIMGEMSMTSSGLSDLAISNGNGKCYANGKNVIDHRRNMKRIKRSNGNHRFVFKSVLHSRDMAKSDNSDKQGSVENLSMKSSGTSELVDNINPPSMMDDISMTNSCASLNSINSDILESRSQSLADPRSDSEMFQRLNAAAAMVQVYSRELSNIMTGSMKSSYNSDNLDQVKPPSVFQEIAEVTVEDGTEVGSDAMISDSELEEELPHDDESSIPSTDTIHSPYHFLTKKEQTEEYTENMNSSFEGDSIYSEKHHHPVKRISNLALTPQNLSIIDIDSNTVHHTSTIDRSKSSQEKNVESKGVELYSKVNFPVCERSGPRIVKPINRETIRQMQEKKSIDKPLRSAHGNINLTSRSLKQSTAVCSTNVSKPKAGRKSVSTVRPTRTSALRASQSQRQTDAKLTGGRLSPRSFLSKPPSRTNKNKVQMDSSCVVLSFKSSDTNDKCQKPLPPVKQGTFTKDEPSQKAPTISSSIESCEAKVFSTQSKKGVDLSEPSETNVMQCSITEAQNLKNTAATTSFANKMVTTLSSASVKKSLSNYSLRRNISLPLQKKENLKTKLKPSPSTQSFEGDKDNGKPTGNTSRVASFSKSSLSSSNYSLRRTNSQKEVRSKISSIWKNNESSSLINSPVTESSPVIFLPGGKKKFIMSKTLFMPSRSTSSVSSALSTEDAAVDSMTNVNSKPHECSSALKKNSLVKTQTKSSSGTGSVSSKFLSCTNKITSIIHNTHRDTQAQNKSTIIRPHSSAIKSDCKSSLKSEAQGIKDTAKRISFSEKNKVSVVSPFVVASNCSRNNLKQRNGEAGSDDNDNDKSETSLSESGKKCLVTAI